MKRYSPAAVAAMKDKYGFQFTKSLGQNFLVDQNIVEKIIDASALEKDGLVIEIGPGVGVLTAAAAERAGKVIAIEIDRKLIPVLEDTFKGYDNVEILRGDILKTDLAGLIEQNERINGVPRKSTAVIGNLPYYITTPVIMKILEDRMPVDRVTVMLQREVADRIKAGPGTKTYGALSVAAQYYCDVTRVANVSREVFVPKPNVDSAVLRLDIRKEKPVSPDLEAVFFACVKMGFAQRRKTLANALTGIQGLDKDAVSRALAHAGIDAGRRAETVSLREFAALASALTDIGRRGSDERT